jgi:hypothetical protein
MVLSYTYIKTQFILFTYLMVVTWKINCQLSFAFHVFTVCVPETLKYHKFQTTKAPSISRSGGKEGALLLQTLLKAAVSPFYFLLCCHTSSYVTITLWRVAAGHNFDFKLRENWERNDKTHLWKKLLIFFMQCLEVITIFLDFECRLLGLPLVKKCQGGVMVCGQKLQFI